MKKSMGVLLFLLAALILLQLLGEPRQAAVPSTTETVTVTFPDITFPELSLPETTQSPAETDPPETTAPATQPPTETTQPSTETTQPSIPPADPLRPYLDLGVCRGLDEAHTFVLFFLDDGDSNWSEEEIAAFNGLYFHPAMNFLQTQADTWGMEVNQESYTYSTQENRNMAYPGIVSPDFQTGGAATDVPDKTAASMGFEDGWDMYRFLQEFTGTDQVAMLFFLNKPGRSYTIRDQTRDGLEELEFSVIFESYPGYTTSATAATIAHELLHLFGAEDYYDPYGDYPQRKALAESQIPDDIMLVTYTDISYNTLSQATAYCVGWTDQVPQIMENPDWNK